MAAPTGHNPLIDRYYPASIARRTLVPTVTLARIFFVILLALNLGALAWLLTRPAPDARGSGATDEGVPALVLLKERDRAAMQQSVLAVQQESSASSVGQPAVPAYCESLGPFPDRATAQAALLAVQPLTRRTQVRNNRARIVRGYWVHIPAHSSREEALATARQLAAAGVRDYYVVTAGDTENTISLGLFHDQGNAEKRREQVAAMGFRARLAERADEREQFWIDYQSLDGQAIAWREAVGEVEGVQPTQVHCF